MTIRNMLVACLIFVGAAIANHALAEPAFRDCPDCLEMRVAEGGEFQMGSIFKQNPNGSITNKDEMPQHPVKVLSFAVSDRLVTSQEWDDCVRSGSCKAILKSGNCPHLANSPVVCVNWFETHEFTRWMTEKSGRDYRLLSEAEWEYAASEKNLFANDRHSGDSGIACLKKIFWQWVEDSYHPTYQNAPTDGSAWRNEDSKNSFKVARNSSCEEYLKSRSSTPSIVGGMNIGFRVARSVE